MNNLNPKVNFFLTVFLILISTCLNAQEYINLESDSNYKCWIDNDQPETSNFKTQKKYKLTFINKVFDTISKKSNIEFNYPQGGCQHRAHIMHLLLEEKNIKHSKIWLFAPKNLEFEQKESLTIKDKNSLTQGSEIEWGYHVAPVVLVENEKKIDTLVFDPSIDNKKPLKIQKWFSSIGNSKISKYTFLNPAKYFFYVKNNNDGTSSQVINGCFYKYQGDTKTKYYTLENGLALNDMAISIYNKHIKPYQSENQNSKINELELIFGNATTLYYLFTRNEEIIIDNVNNAVKSNPKIIEEARTTYKERFKYWKNRIVKSE